MSPMHPVTTPALRGWLAFTSVVCVVFGIASIFAPSAVGRLYGSDTNAHGLLWARYYGAAILFPGIISWLARSAPTRSVARSVVGTLAAMFTINLGVSLYGWFADLMNTFHGSTIAFEVVLIVVFGSYAVRLRA